MAALDHDRNRCSQLFLHALFETLQGLQHLLHIKLHVWPAEGHLAFVWQNHPDRLHHHHRRLPSDKAEQISNHVQFCSVSCQS